MSSPGVAMRITSADTIAGVPLISVRDVLRTVKDGHFGTEFLEDRLDLDADTAERVVSALRDAGYIESAPVFDDDDSWWRTTLAGNALANASAARPVKRATAQRALDEMIERAEEINADPDYVFQVDEVVLFGSFLDPDSDTVGDVDVAVGLSSRYQDSVEFKPRSSERIALAKASGRSFSNVLDEISWPQQEVIKRLKARSRVLSLTFTQDGILDQVPYRVVYRREGATPHR